MKEQTITFEDVKLSLFKWAHYFRARSQGQFEFWELINAAWADGKVRFLLKSEVTLSSGRIRWDMIHYMREREGIRRRQHAEKTGYTLPFTATFSEINALMPEGVQIEKTKPSKTNLFADIAAKDLLNHITSLPTWSKREKLILKLYYIEGLNQREVAKVCGCTESCICLIRVNLIERLKALDYAKII